MRVTKVDVKSLYPSLFNRNEDLRVELLLVDEHHILLLFDDCRFVGVLSTTYCQYIIESAEKNLSRLLTIMKSFSSAVSRVVRVGSFSFLSVGP